MFSCGTLWENYLTFIKKKKLKTSWTFETSKTNNFTVKWHQPTVHNGLFQKMTTSWSRDQSFQRIQTKPNSVRLWLYFIPTSNCKKGREKSQNQKEAIVVILAVTNDNVINSTIKLLRSLSRSELNKTFCRCCEWWASNKRRPYVQIIHATSVATLSCLCMYVWCCKQAICFLQVTYREDQYSQSITHPESIPEKLSFHADDLPS